jgi:hypothetical protein
MIAQLETPTFSNLAAFIGNRFSRTIGNNTVARADWRDGSKVIDIEFHGNRIATLRLESVELTNAGWETVKTRERLNTIAQANGLGLKFGQRKGVQTINGEPWDGTHVARVQLSLTDEELDRYYASQSMAGNEIVG